MTMNFPQIERLVSSTVTADPVTIPDAVRALPRQRLVMLAAHAITRHYRRRHPRRAEGHYQAVFAALLDEVRQLRTPLVRGLLARHSPAGSEYRGYPRKDYTLADESRDAGCWLTPRARLRASLAREQAGRE